MGAYFKLLMTVGSVMLLHVCDALDPVKDIAVEKFRLCPEKPEETFHYRCKASGFVDDARYKCWVTSFNSCDGVKWYGELSICTDSRSEVVYKCEGGRWNQKSKTSEKKQRVKRWLFWRRRRSRTTTVPDNPPSITCPGSIIVSAPPREITATVTWSTPTASDDHGIKSVSQSTGLPSGSNFPERTSLIGYKATDTRGQTAHCQFNVTVNVIRCSALPDFRHGSRHCTGKADNVYGSTCSHSCDRGYTLRGDSSISCQNSGNWSSSFPSCQVVSCGDPGQVAGGSIECRNGHTYPQDCEIHCNTGYTHTGLSTVSCTAGGTWTDKDPCKDVDPPRFPNGCPPNQNLFSGPLKTPVPVTWVDPDVTDNDGQPPSLTSFPTKGSTLGPGSHTVNITATDVSGNMATCHMTATVQVRECPKAVCPSNGNVSCTSDHVEGSVCSVSCNYGYELKGQSALTCLVTEQWDAVFPTCEAVVCPIPPPVLHSTFSCLNGRQYPAVCNLTCAAGFKVRGVAGNDIQCQLNGTWSQPGSCQDVQAPVFDNGCPNNINVYAVRLGHKTIVNWTEPLVSDNSGDVINLTSNVKSGSAFPVGTTVVTYEATDTSGNVERCYANVTVSALECGAQDLQPVQGNNSSPLQELCPDGYVHGATCTLSCVRGYRLQGRDAITCQRDDSTHPPSMTWQWSGSLSVKPQCKEDRCPPLSPPENGAFLCWLGDYGWHCYISCNSDWDVRATFDGRLICTNQEQIWRPSPVPKCVVRHLPRQVRMMPDLLYITGSCDVSIDRLQQHFMSIINQSIYKTTCATIRACKADHVKVTCSSVPSRGKRYSGIDNKLMTRLRRARRHTAHLQASHYVHVMFRVSEIYDEDTESPEQAYQDFSAKAVSLVSDLKSQARSGELNIDGLVAEEYTVGHANLGADCPPGTVYRSAYLQTRFSCVPIQTT